MLSLAREYSTHSSRDLRSMGLSFQRRVGSARRRWNRRSCSASETENQYLTRMIPERSSIRSNSGQAARATTRAMRGLRLSVILLIVPPLPAASRPSNRTTTLSPACLTHSWSLISSSCSLASSSSYSFFLSLVAAFSSASSASRGLAALVLAMRPPSPDPEGRVSSLAMGTRTVEHPPLGGDQRL